MHKFLEASILKWSRIEVIFWSLMIGAGEVYIGAYAIACGFSDRYSGLITALPLGIASILQLFTGRLRKLFKARKHFVIVCAAGQAFALFAITGHGLFAKDSPDLLMFMLTMYWICGLTAGPVWNAWIVSIVAKPDRPSFFAKRGPFHEITVLCALVTAGFILNYSQNKMLVFAMLFVFAGLARLGSAGSLSKLPNENARVDPDPADALDLISFKDWIRERKVRWMLVLLGSFNFGVYIGSPFFTPFMLRQLQLSHSTYMLLIALPFISRALAYRQYERIIKRVGILPVLLPAAGVIAIVPALWAWLPVLPALVLFQIVSGFAWSGFEYSILMKQLSEFPPKERSRVLTWTNFIVGFCNILGVSIGSQLLGSQPTMDDYFNIFFASAAVRAIGICSIFAVDWRISKYYLSKLYVRTLGLRFNRGGVERPILYVDDK
jgi:hypothetical protein